MNLSKGQRASIGIGAIVFVYPLAFYLVNRLFWLLPPEAEWWEKGINHGPWRWEWQMIIILPPIYFLSLGSAVLLGTGLYQGSKQKQVVVLANYGVIAAVYFVLFYIQAHTIFWTID